MKRVYIAGPYSKGNVMENIFQALNAAEYVWRLGCVPFVPHLTGFWDLVWRTHSYEDWMAYDAQWLLACDAVFRMQGESSGADREVKMAEENSIPVFYDLISLSEWLHERDKPAD